MGGDVPRILLLLRGDNYLDLGVDRLSIQQIPDLGVKTTPDSVIL